MAALPPLRKQLFSPTNPHFSRIHRARNGYPSIPAPENIFRKVPIPTEYFGTFLAFAVSNGLGSLRFSGLS